MATLDTLRRSTAAAVCLECGKCSTLCPLVRFEPAPFGPFSASRLAAIRDTEEATNGGRTAVERCLTCGLCEVRCPQGVRFVDFVGGLRRQLEGDWPLRCSHGDVLRAASRMAADAEAPERRHDWLDDDLRVAEEGEIGLFVGCLPLYDVLFEQQLGIRPTDIARSAVRLLNRLGIEPVVAPDERCCGHDLLWSGDEESFKALATANADAFRARGVKHLLTACAECCRTWRLDYPQAAPGFRPRVEHLAEFLATRLGDEEGLFAANGESCLTYHDPCRLGRHLGVYDQPRQVIEAVPGVELEEMAAHGRDAVCCGTSGFTYCDAASRGLQLERLESAAAAGAETMITTCPKCWIHFVCAQAGERRRGAEPPEVWVEDFTMFVANRLTAPTARPQPATTEEKPGGPS
ncbi:MAG: (Fe-S)-binding protein [Thermoanaerobaculia bacterium]